MSRVSFEAVHLQQSRTQNTRLRHTSEINKSAAKRWLFLHNFWQETQEIRNFGCDLDSISHSDLVAILWVFLSVKVFSLTTIFFNSQTHLRGITMWQLFRISPSRFFQSEIYAFLFRVYWEILLLFSLWFVFVRPYWFDCCLLGEHNWVEKIQAELDYK
jgi:hypothetical protein